MLLEKIGTKYTKKLFKNYLQRCKTVIKCNYFSKAYKTLARLMCFRIIGREEVAKVHTKEGGKSNEKKACIIAYGIVGVHNYGLRNSSEKVEKICENT